MQQKVMYSKAISRTRQTSPNMGLGFTTPLYNSVGEYAPDAKFVGWSQHLNEDTALYLYNYRKRGASTIGSMGTALGQESITERRFNRGSMNNVVHTKCGLLNLPFGMMWTPAWGGVYIADFNRVFTTRGYATKLAEPTTAYGQLYAPGSDTLFSSRAYWSMRPKFHGDVSVINSIFELKDFRDVSSYGNLIKKFLSVQSNALKLRRVRGYGTDHRVKVLIGKNGTSNPFDFTDYGIKDAAHDATGVAASMVLAYNLAIKPTIADAMAIMAQCATAAMDAQRAFALSGDEGSLSHYSEQFTPIASGIRGSRSYDCYFTGMFTHVKRTATMRSYYAYTMRPLNEALAHYWGLTGTVEALWNMLPMSFVLDYIFTIGKALRMMATDRNVRNLTYEYCESTAVTSGDGISIYHDPRVRSLIIDGKFYKPRQKVQHLLVSGTECTRFARRVMDPVKGPAFPVFRKPSPSQLANVAALVRLFV